jgi:hypothetical protein
MATLREDGEVTLSADNMGHFLTCGVLFRSNGSLGRQPEPPAAAGVRGWTYDGVSRSIGTSGSSASLLSGGFGQELLGNASTCAASGVFPVYVSLTHIPLRNVENHGFSCKTLLRRLASENRLTGTGNDGRGSDST